MSFNSGNTPALQIRTVGVYSILAWWCAYPSFPTPSVWVKQLCCQRVMTWFGAEKNVGKTPQCWVLSEVSVISLAVANRELPILQLAWGCDPDKGTEIKITAKTKELESAEYIINHLPNPKEGSKAWTREQNRWTLWWAENAPCPQDPSSVAGGSVG